MPLRNQPPSPASGLPSIGVITDPAIREQFTAIHDAIQDLYRQIYQQDTGDKPLLESERISRIDLQGDELVIYKKVAYHQLGREVQETDDIPLKRIKISTAGTTSGGGGSSSSTATVIKLGWDEIGT